MTTRVATMTDVARHVGVSRSAVSFAFNDPTQVSDDTRRRVLAAATELGYRPNAGARALAGRATDLYGLVTDIVSTPFGGDLIAGAQEWFWEHGKSLLIVGTPTPDRPRGRSVDLMLEHRVGGVMIATTWNRMITVPKVLSGSRVVLVHCADDAGRYPSIVPDEVSGGHAATRLLLDRGRRRIALINLDPTLVAAQQRRDGYERALREAGVAVDRALVASGGADADGGYEAARDLLARAKPDAFFCANDRLAMGAYEAIREAGLRIPEDISVVGFDNQELISAHLRPKLTSIALPFHEMGRRAAEMLMLDEDPLPQTVVACPPVERYSI